MFAKFTERAREAMRLANEEALGFGREEQIDTHHLLVGMLKAESGVAAHVLNARGIDACSVRAEIELLGEHGPSRDQQGKLPMTLAASNVVERSLEEAGLLGHTYAGTEHLLLALLRERECVSAEIFRNLNVQPEVLRKDVLNLLGHELGD